MKKSLKTLSLVLFFSMMAAFIPLTGRGMTVFADGDFTIKDDVLTKYTGSGGDMVIADGVTTIDSNAFSYGQSLTARATRSIPILPLSQ